MTIHRLRKDVGYNNKHKQLWLFNDSYFFEWQYLSRSTLLPKHSVFWHDLLLLLKFCSNSELTEWFWMIWVHSESLKRFTDVVTYFDLLVLQDDFFVLICGCDCVLRFFVSSFLDWSRVWDFFLRAFIRRLCSMILSSRIWT